MALKKRKNSNTGNFSTIHFTAQQLADSFGLSRSIIYQYVKDKILKTTEKTVGTKKVNVFTWDEVQVLANRIGDKMKKPKENKIKVFSNLKGGVGKSTLASQVAMTSASCGLKTLIIDLDPQAHASKSIGFEVNEDAKTIQDVLVGLNGQEKSSLEDVMEEITPFLFLVPSNLGLSTLERKLFNETKREQRLAAFLNRIRNDWDMIILDTNPSASMVNINAILAADELCIVSATDYLAVNGLKNLFSILQELEEDFEHTPNVRIIPNLYDIRDGIAQESLGFLRKEYKEYTTKVVVRKNTDIREAQKLGQVIWQFNKKSAGSEDIMELTKELINEAEG
jgi:chromosome partitioning protein